MSLRGSCHTMGCCPRHKYLSPVYFLDLEWNLTVKPLRWGLCRVTVNILPVLSHCQSLWDLHGLCWGKGLREPLRELLEKLLHSAASGMRPGLGRAAAGSKGWTQIEWKSECCKRESVSGKTVQLFLLLGVGRHGWKKCPLHSFSPQSQVQSLLQQTQSGNHKVLS